MTISPWHLIALGIGGVITTYALHRLWKTARATAEHHLFLNDIQKTVVPVDSSLIHPRNNGKLVFVVGKIEKQGEKIVDPLISWLRIPSVLAVKRVVEIYQRVERKYSFSDFIGYIPSETFHYKEYNPIPQLQYQTHTTHLKLGDYQISNGIIPGIPEFQNSQPEFQNSQPKLQNSNLEFQYSQPELQNSNLEFQNSQPVLQNSNLEFKNSQPEFQNSNQEFRNSKLNPHHPEHQNFHPESQKSQPEFQNFRLEFQNFRPDNFHKTKDDWMYLCQEVEYDWEAFEKMKKYSDQVETNNNLTDVEKLEILQSLTPIKKTRVVLRENEPEKPNLGDIRVKFQIIEEGVVSIIAKQEDNKLVQFSSPKNKPFSLFGRGDQSIDELCHHYDTQYIRSHFQTNFFDTLLAIFGVTIIQFFYMEITRQLFFYSAVLGLTLSTLVVGTAWLSCIFFGDRFHNSCGTNE